MHELHFHLLFSLKSILPLLALRSELQQWMALGGFPTDTRFSEGNLAMTSSCAHVLALHHFTILSPWTTAHPPSATHPLCWTWVASPTPACPAPTYLSIHPSLKPQNKTSPIPHPLALWLIPSPFNFYFSWLVHSRWRSRACQVSSSLPIGYVAEYPLTLQCASMCWEEKNPPQFSGRPHLSMHFLSPLFLLSKPFLKQSSGKTSMGGMLILEAMSY